MDSSDKKELSQKGKKGFIKEEQADIKAAKKGYPAKPKGNRKDSRKK